MKKGLSILLVAAALFGFYGSAVNLNDILACKDYWEEQSEKTTADLNKLEDGLNQLRENEQAYLDGKDQIADGEESLAEAEQKLADAEQQLDEGRATLAKAEADFAAAPAKLAAAKKKLSAGEDQIADGQDSIDGLTKLISGINTIVKGYEKQWKPNYDKLADARGQLYDGTKAMKDQMLQLGAFLPTEAEQKAFAAAVNDVAGDDEKQTAKDYKEFIKSTNDLEKSIPKIQKAVQETYTNASNLLKLLKAQPDNFNFAKAVSENKKAMLALASLITDEAKNKQYTAGVETIAAAFENFDDTVDKQYAAYMNTDEGQQTEAYLVSQNMETGWTAFFASDSGKQAVAGTKRQMAIAGLAKAGVTDPTEDQIAQAVASINDADAQTMFRNSGSDNAKAAEAAVTEQVTAQVDAGIKETVKGKVLAAYEDPEGDLAKGKAAMIADVNEKGEGGAVSLIVASLKEANDILQSDKVNKTLLGGLKQFNESATDDAIDTLSSGQNTLAGGVSTVASAVLGNKTLKAGVKKNMGSKAVSLLKTYKNKTNPLSASVSNFAAFEKQMDKLPAVISNLKKARSLLAATKADGLKTLSAAKKTLAAGYKQYNQGVADYKAAPGKLADGRKTLADGEAQLADGYKTYNEGQKTLADAKSKLAEYEDGEQQARDGLATLAGTEADPGVESILDRLSGDDNFDDANGHLEIDEGLNAVEAGRGYQADDGVLITDEIMARAVGTGALIGAGALALIAAILSFLKKNKGAGVFAILAAAAGAFGAFYGTNAGTYFSDIAGSTAGNAGWVAAGILAAIALVHSIVHFTAKKEA